MIPRRPVSHKRRASWRPMKTIFHVAVSLGSMAAFLYWAFSDIDSGSLLSAFDDVGLVWLVATVAMTLATAVVRGWRWGVLLRPVAPHVSLVDATLALSIGYAVNLVSPVPRAGEGARALSLKWSPGIPKRTPNGRIRLLFECCSDTTLRRSRSARSRPTSVRCLDPSPNAYGEADVDIGRRSISPGRESLSGPWSMVKIVECKRTRPFIRVGLCGDAETRPSYWATSVGVEPSRIVLPTVPSTYLRAQRSAAPFRPARVHHECNVSLRDRTATPSLPQSLVANSHTRAAVRVSAYAIDRQWTFSGVTRGRFFEDTGKRRRSQVTDRWDSPRSRPTCEPAV